MAEVKHNLVARLLAGHDSPSTALRSALFILSEHPDHRQAVASEYECVVGEGQPTASALKHLSRTRRVVRETRRLYPPTTGINRRATEAVNLCGYDVEVGDAFVLLSWVVHRDDRFWDDPARLEPGRWRRHADRPHFAYFPFSGGRRACLGGDVARQGIVIVLTTILGRVDREVTAEGPLCFESSILLRPEAPAEAVLQAPAVR